MFRRILTLTILTAAFSLSGPVLSTADACPMCKEANESDDNLPKAYMYSILFMLSVPAMVISGFGVGVYRLSKQRDAMELPGADDLTGDHHQGPADLDETDPVS